MGTRGHARDPRVASHDSARGDSDKKKLVKQKRWNFTPDRQKAIDEEVEKLWKVGIICKVKYSNWVANIFLVKKPNKKWRICVDYIDLNTVCPKDSYSFPSIDQLIYATSGQLMLSFVDAFSGYNQIKNEPRGYQKDCLHHSLGSVRLYDHAFRPY